MHLASRSLALYVFGSRAAIAPDRPPVAAMHALRSTPALFIAGALVGFLSLTGCDSDSGEELTRSDIAGTYGATSFTVEDGDQTVDVLDAGGDLAFTLREDGTASGVLVIPEELNEEGGGNARLLFGGTYALSGNEVTFDHEADTFVRDAVWTFGNGDLRTDTGEITVVLSRQ